MPLPPHTHSLSPPPPHAPVKGRFEQEARHRNKLKVTSFVTILAVRQLLRPAPCCQSPLLLRHSFTVSQAASSRRQGIRRRWRRWRLGAAACLTAQSASTYRCGECVDRCRSLFDGAVSQYTQVWGTCGQCGQCRLTELWGEMLRQRTESFLAWLLIF